MTARGQFGGAVEDADVVEPQESAREEVLALRVFAVDPPGEVDQELLEDAREEDAVALSAGGRDLVDAPGRPRVDGRVDVSEGPLVSRDLPVGMHIPLAQEEDELLLGELRIDPRHRDHVEGEVPRRVPGVLPLVGH